MGFKLKFQGIEQTTDKLGKIADMTAVKAALKKNTVALQKDAIRRMPVTYVKGYSTGFTEQHTNSYISNGDLTGKVIMETNYSQYVELGTRYMAAEPVMKPALNEIYPQFLSDVKKAAKGG